MFGLRWGRAARPVRPSARSSGDSQIWRAEVTLQCAICAWRGRGNHHKHLTHPAHRCRSCVVAYFLHRFTSRSRCRSRSPHVERIKARVSRHACLGTLQPTSRPWPFELYRRNVTSARLRKLPRTVATKGFGSRETEVAGLGAMLGARVRGSGGSSVLVLLVAAFHASHTLERLSSCTKLSVDSVVRSVGASLRRASVSASLESSELTRRRLGTPMDEVMRDA